jgi:predicted HD phosphohydrolase
MADPTRAKFRAMTEGTAEDWQIIANATVTVEPGQELSHRVLAHLRLMGGDYSGYAVDRLTHSLQSAHRAEQAGRSDDYVLCALLHDIGDTLGPYNHQDVAAAILSPFVDEDLHWMVAHHGDFQGYYFFHHLGLDRNRRDRYLDCPHYEITAEFCADFDQTSFDPDYPTPPLEYFEPLVHSIMKTPKRSMYLGTD